MKISGTRKSGTNANPNKRIIVPVIPLERPTTKTYAKNEVLTFALKANPAQADSSTYNLTVPFFSTGTPEEAIIFVRNLRKVIVGQNVTTGPGMYALARRLLQGDALTAFDVAATIIGTETEANFNETVLDLLRHIFPVRALMNQKRYMRRALRKPRTMSTREFMARMVELNSYLREFPEWVEGRELADEELLDIAEYATPASWQKAMVMHDFQPILGTPSEFVEFCERIEYSETTDTTSSGKNSQTPASSGDNGPISDAKSTARGNNNKTNNNKRKQDRRNVPSTDGSKYCVYHNTNGHDTGECKVVLAQAKRMRQTWESRDATGTNKNKTWTRDQNGKTTKESAEMHATIAEAVKRAMKTSEAGKKRKSDAELHTITEEFQMVKFPDSDTEVE